MTTILVTGAAGFIGSQLVERLMADGHRVVGVDNFDPFYARAVKERNTAVARSHARFDLWEIDLRDAAALAARVNSAGARVDAIVHLAAKAGVRPSMSDPVAYQEVNVAGTQNLLELARRLGVPQTWTDLAKARTLPGYQPRVPLRDGLRAFVDWLDQAVQPKS